MAVQIQIRRDTAANWASNDPVLAEGELGWETDTGTVLKIGDGSTNYSGLANLLSGAGGDHLLLSNIGVNTHAQIDTHLADATVHFTEASIDHTNIQDIGVNSHTQIDAHIADTSIHFAEGTIDHTALLNIGTNTHAQIDTHIATAGIHFTEASIDHTNITNIGTNSHAAIDSHIADATLHFTEASIDHTAIANIGTNSHAQIDTHIGTANIHYVDAPADGNQYARLNNAWSIVAAATVPGGADTDVQFNNAGAFGGSSDFTWDNSGTKTFEVNADDLTLSDIGNNASLQITRAGAGSSMRTDVFTPLRLESDVQSRPVMYMEEIAAAVEDVAGFGQYWVRNDNTPMFTDDGGTDYELNSSGVTDHTLLTNIGVNTHAQIDTHIADATIHFTEASIDHTAISNIGTNSHAQIDTHIADATIHFTEASIDHLNIANIGTNSHAQIDTHIADGTIHFTEASIDHLNIANIGTNSHAQIDSHIASTANPHQVTLQQAFDQGNIIDSTTAGLGIPDMTTAQRTALTDVAGLVVYDTDIGQLHQNDGAGWSIPGAGLTTMQNAYDNSLGADPMITLNATPTPLSIQASVSGSVLEIRDVGAVNTVFQVDADPDAVTARAGVTILNSFVNAGAAADLILNNTFTQTGGFVGGGIQSLGTITTGVSTTWIWALLQESKAYQIGINPAFAAFTLFNAIASISNSGNFNLPQGLILNNGLQHRRVTAGTSTTAQTTGLNDAPGNVTTAAGAVLTRTVGINSVVSAPTWNTAFGSTVNLGTCTAVRVLQPAQALFGSSAGVENITARIGLDWVNHTFGGASATRAVIRSNQAAGTNTRFLNHTGTAQSDLGGPLRFLNDFPNGVLTMGASADFSMGWVAAGQFYMQLNTPAVSQMRFTSPALDRIVMSHALNQGEFNFQCDRFSMGQSGGAVGNQVGNFVTPARTITVAGEWADFLLTQGGNITVNGNNMSRVSGWVINGPSYASSSGTVSLAETLTVGGMVTSAPGVTITERQSLHVIAGRSRFRSAMEYDSRDGGALAAGDTNDSGVLLTGSANNNMRHWVRIQGDGGGTSAITGFDATAAQDGDCFKITNDSANSFDIDHQAAGSAAANRVISPTGTDYTLGPDESCEIIYDSNATRWRILYGSGA